VDRADQLAVADANMISAFDVLREHVADPGGGNRAFGAVRAIATGIEAAFFNPILALADGSTADDVLAAVDWMRSRGIEPVVQVAEAVDATLGGSLRAAGFQADTVPTPVMVLEPIPDSPLPLPGVEIRIGGAELHEDWHVALDSGPIWRHGAGPGFLGDPRNRFGVAYLDGEPVSAAAAFRFASSLGVYAVGTREHARRRGIGRAVTWAVIAAGQAAWGSEIAILQSSTMGFPVYRSMGFEQVGALIEYRPPTPRADGADAG